MGYALRGGPSPSASSLDLTSAFATGAAGMAAASCAAIALRPSVSARPTAFCLVGRQGLEP
jgi:hypothetical protein